MDQYGVSQLCEVAEESQECASAAAGCEGPYVLLFRDTIWRAHEIGASDIHFQPTRDGVDIRARVFGDLQSIRHLSIEHRQSFLQEAKRLCGFSIAVAGRAQDSRISLPEKHLDLRASLVPTQFGEKIVLRLLNLSQTFHLSRSGLDEEVQGAFANSLTANDGIILVSGPTGSGKTTLLNHLIGSLDRQRKNIVTLEDPIEYSIPGLSQIQISEKLSFAQALRSILRQDPDVILVGEIRDQETADLCFKAASTGHLVLSTLHANSAAETVTRLLDLGVSRFLLESCLRFSAAQRLVRRICRACSVKAPQEIHARFETSLDRDDVLKVRNPTGCLSCRQGSTGRVPVVEYLDQEAIRGVLGDGVGPLNGKTRTLRDAAVVLAGRGEVDAREALELG